MDVEAQVIQLAKDGKTVHHMSEVTGLTRTQIANVLIEYVNETKESQEAISPENTKSSNLSVSEENTNDKNSRELTVKYVGKKKSLEELLSELEIDKSIWEVSNVTYNEWDGMRPNDQGTIKLHQLKVSFKRIKLVVNYDIPAAINITMKTDFYRKEVYTTSEGIKTAVVLPDMQVGFKRNMMTGELTSLHDRRAMDVALQITKHVRPNRIVLLGDNLDLAQESKYPSGPEFYFTTQAAAVELAWWLAQLRDIDPEIEIDYISGNHDCFSEDTEILTEHGWANYFEVEEDTKIATFNKQTKNIEFQNYIEKQVYDYNGEMYSIKNSACDLLITPNHRVYWATGNKDSEFNMNEIGKIPLNTCRKVQYCAGINNRSDFDISDDMIRLIAWIITDGSIKRIGNYSAINLWQREEKVHLILAILNRLNITYKISSRLRDIKSICGVELKKPSKVACSVSINASESKKILKYIDNKYVLPDWVYELSEQIGRAHV